MGFTWTWEYPAPRDVPSQVLGQRANHTLGHLLLIAHHKCHHFRVAGVDYTGHQDSPKEEIKYQRDGGKEVG